MICFSCAVSLSIRASKKRQFGSGRPGGEGLRNRRPFQLLVRELPADEDGEHLPVAGPRRFDLRRLLSGGEELGFHGVGVALHGRAVALQRPYFFEVVAQQPDRQAALRQPLVEQQDAEIEVVHPPLQRIEVNIRRAAPLRGFGFGQLFVSRRFTPVPERLVQFDLHLVLVPVQPRNIQPLGGQKPGHLFRKAGHVGLPGGLGRQGEPGQPGPPGVRQRIVGRAADQVILPDFGIVLTCQCTTFVERQLRMRPAHRGEGKAEE